MRLACWRARLAIADFSADPFLYMNETPRKDRFGVTPLRLRSGQALPAREDARATLNGRSRRRVALPAVNVSQPARSFRGPATGAQAPNGKRDR
jgi:hypothetical protein